MKLFWRLIAFVMKGHRDPRKSRGERKMLISPNLAEVTVQIKDLPLQSTKRMKENTLIYFFTKTIVLLQKLGQVAVIARY